MKAMVCKQCGAPINPRTMMCEYCGTKYRDEPTFSVLHIERPGAITLGAAILVPDEEMWLLKDDIGHIVRNEMTRKLAEAIEPNVEYMISEDPMQRAHIVKGRIRILPPGYRF